MEESSIGNKHYSTCAGLAIQLYFCHIRSWGSNLLIVPAHPRGTIVIHKCQAAFARSSPSQKCIGGERFSGEKCGREKFGGEKCGGEKRR